MKLAELIKEIEEKQAYKEFIEDNKDAYLAAGFFILDDAGQDSFQLDFFIPSKNKIAVSAYPFATIAVQEDVIKQASKLENPKIDISDLRLKVDEVIKENKSDFKSNKIIGILKDNKWNLTCMSNSLGLLRLKIDSLTGNVEKFEKMSFFDIMRVSKK